MRVISRKENDRLDQTLPPKFANGIDNILPEARRYVRNRTSATYIASPERLWWSVILESTSSKYQIQTLLTQRGCVIGQRHTTKVQIIARAASFDITLDFQNRRQSGDNRKRFTQAILQIRYGNTSVLSRCDIGFKHKLTGRIAENLQIREV
jgi:hypothetical protein